VLVLDASALVDFLIHRRSRGDWVGEQIAGVAVLHSPHLVDVEVASALRRLVAATSIEESTAERAIRLLPEVRLRRYPVAHLLPRIWSLPATLTAYDAAYVALAEALDLPLVTTDQRLARACGHVAEIRAYET
jgi:predicted nucleic acid-binding protein